MKSSYIWSPFYQMVQIHIYLLCNGSGQDGTCLLLVSKKSPPLKLVFLLQAWVSSFFVTISCRCLTPKTLLPSPEALNTMTRRNPSCHFEITMASNSLKHTYTYELSIFICLFSLFSFQANQRVLWKFMYIYMHIRWDMEEGVKRKKDKCLEVAGPCGEGAH